MPAQSQQQQKLFGLALAYKRGEVPASEVSDEIKNIADRMSEKEIEDFAATKHKGLPTMKEQLRKIVREIMRERAIAEIELSKADMDKLHSDGEVEVDGEKVSFEEGKKRFRQQDGIGKAKYTISYHDGKKKHKDGSDFFDIKIFKNKKDLSDFVGTLVKQGYKLTNESVNEAVSKEAMGIAGFTGTRGIAVQKFIDDYNLHSKKLFNFVKKGKLKDRLAFVTAIAGKPGNKYQGDIVGMFGESVNEGYSTEEKRIVMMAVRKIAKYMNVDIKTAMVYVLGAGQELERDIKKGKITK